LGLYADEARLLVVFLSARSALLLSSAAMLALAFFPTPSAYNGPDFVTSVAPIVHRSCTPCHRKGGVAPFELATYEQCKKWSRNIAKVTATRAMPPWKATPGYGDFKQSHALSDTEIKVLQDWNVNQAPRGEGEEPAPPKFAETEWPLGKPDLILQPKHPFWIGSEGPDLWRHFVLDPKITAPTYVRAFDIRPGNASTVHHVVLFIDRQGKALKLQERENDGQEGYSAFGFPGFTPDGSWGGWVPGTQSSEIAEDAGFLLLPGDQIVMQVHYTRTGKQEVDRTRTALYWKNDKPRHVLEVAWLGYPFFRLKPGESSQWVSQRFPIREAIRIYFLIPHMHLLGKSLRAVVLLPDGSRIPLIWIQNWDFNWQLTYHLRTPLNIPKGSNILVEAEYDNSSNNPHQPYDPPREVLWGYQTRDEMHMLVVGYSSVSPP